MRGSLAQERARVRRGEGRPPHRCVFAVRLEAEAEHAHDPIAQIPRVVELDVERGEARVRHAAVGLQQQRQGKGRRRKEGGVSAKGDLAAALPLCPPCAPPLPPPAPLSTLRSSPPPACPHLQHVLDDRDLAQLVHAVDGGVGRVAVALRDGLAARLALLRELDELQRAGRGASRGIRHVVDEVERELVHGADVLCLALGVAQEHAEVEDGVNIDVLRRGGVWTAAARLPPSAESTCRQRGQRAAPDVDEDLQGRWIGGGGGVKEGAVVQRQELRGGRTCTAPRVSPAAPRCRGPL